MSYLNDIGYESCAQLYHYLKSINNKNIDYLSLRCFKLYKESDEKTLRDDICIYLLKLIEYSFSKAYFHYYVTCNQIISKMPNNNTMSYQEIFCSFKETLLHEANSLKNEPLSYLVLSHFFQASICVRNLKTCKKLKNYDIEKTPYTIYILEDNSKRFILVPFEKNFDWRSKELKTSFITVSYMESLENLRKEWCKKCKSETKNIHCTNFHFHCFECLDDFKCDLCDQDDYFLMYFFYKSQENKGDPIMKESDTGCKYCGKSQIKDSRLCQSCLEFINKIISS